MLSQRVYMWIWFDCYTIFLENDMLDNQYLCLCWYSELYWPQLLFCWWGYSQTWTVLQCPSNITNVTTHDEVMKSRCSLGNYVMNTCGPYNWWTFVILPLYSDDTWWTFVILPLLPDDTWWTFVILPLPNNTWWTFVILPLLPDDTWWTFVILPLPNNTWWTFVILPLLPDDTWGTFVYFYNCRASHDELWLYCYDCRMTHDELLLYYYGCHQTHDAYCPCYRLLVMTFLILPVLPDDTWWPFVILPL